MKALMMALVAVFAVSSVSFASGHDAKKKPVKKEEGKDAHGHEGEHKDGEHKEEAKH